MRDKKKKAEPGSALLIVCPETGGNGPLSGLGKKEMREVLAFVNILLENRGFCISNQATSMRRPRAPNVGCVASRSRPNGGYTYLLISPAQNSCQSGGMRAGRPALSMHTWAVYPMARRLPISASTTS